MKGKLYKMKKAVIVTLFDDNNIGNRLQNYALQKMLQLRNMEVVVLDNGYTTIPSIIMSLKIYIKEVLCLFGVKKYKDSYKKYYLYNHRRKAMENFDAENIDEIKKVSNKSVFKLDWSQYDLCIAGSDQIWHKWGKDIYELPFYYLQFVPYEMRMAYAASFGFEEFPMEDIEQHKQGLQGMKYISCRELSGCNLVSEITGKKIPQVLDPTLLLGISEWRNIEAQASEFAKNQKNYAFVYFLGEQTDEYRDWIKNIMKTQKIDMLIDFSDYTSQDICNCGPADFLSLIDRAEYVFTDSFHCTVFSVLFDKRFTVFRRKQEGFEKMFGRIEDLLASKGKLENIFGGTSRVASNDFEKLYLESIQYLDKITKINS